MHLTLGIMAFEHSQHFAENLNYALVVKSMNSEESLLRHLVHAS